MLSLRTIILLLKRIPWLGRWINRFATNQICMATTPRPRAFSLWSHSPKPAPPEEQGPPGEYTCWPMLTDRLYSSRHLPPLSEAYIKGLPEDEMPINGRIGDVTKLFMREGEMDPGRSTSLFMFFAQWFTDSVLRVDPSDRRKNTSNHNIDLCQIYGLTEETARILRRKDGSGKLRSQIINGEEFLDHLGELDANGQWQVKSIYQDLPYVKDGRIDYIMSSWDEERKHKLYATGLERGNSSIGYVAISTLFMREHNRICDELAQRNPRWDDERLFQTARMINIVLLMKLVVVDYINHIGGAPLFEFDVDFAEQQPWYRTPWIALEFDMLYRWHGLVPDYLQVQGQQVGHLDYRFNNELLEKYGFNEIVHAASMSPAGKIDLKNVPTFMAMAEYQAIKMGRDFRLACFNDYRRHFGMEPYSSFTELTGNEALAAELESLYGDVDRVELFVGLFAEKNDEARLYGSLMYTMVAYDAFTQIYTNPLLSKNVYNEATLTEYGLELIDNTNSVQELVDRNNQTGGEAMAFFSRK